MTQTFPPLFGSARYLAVALFSLTVVAGNAAQAGLPATHAFVAPQGASGDPKPTATRPKRAATRLGNVKPVSTRKPAAPRPLAWSAPHGATALSDAVGAVLASHTKSGTWGAIIVSLTRGDTLYEQNPDAMMQPASTMKMYTSAVALDRFGPDFTFRTAALRDGVAGPDGVLAGNLYLRGVGDPSLSSRFWHDQEPMDVLAKQIAAAGIKRVRGDIIGDATAFDDKLVPDGWKTSYLGASYAARVSALSLNENLVWVVVKPEGSKASVTLEPATTTTNIDASVRVVGGTGGRISASRRPDGTITVRGTIGARSGALKYSLVVDNPPLFTTGALRASLQKAGVTVDGVTKLGAVPPGATEIAALSSPPLAQIIGEMDRESINVVAELLFRASARSQTTQVGSAETALANLREFLSKKVGTAPTVVDVSDGSGLSLLDRVTARSMVQLLGYVHQRRLGTDFPRGAAGRR